MSNLPSWKRSFAEGIEKFRLQDLDGALNAFDEVLNNFPLRFLIRGMTSLHDFQAIRLADGASYVLYDSRASVYEKRNRFKDALRDAKKTIDIAPAQWHGYFRSARLFASLNRSSAALRMCSLALERFGDDAKHQGRRRELTALRCQLEAQTKSPIAGMPVELLLMVFDFACRPVTLSHVCRRWRDVALAHPTLWHSLVLTEPPKKALHKVREWHRRRGQVAELTIRKSLGGVILKPSEADQMAHPNDLAMRDEILAELRRLDLTYVRACHLEDVDVSLFLNSLWGNTCSPGPQRLETLSISQSSLGRGVPLGKTEHTVPSWANLRAFRIINMECHWPAFTVFVRGLTSFEYKISGFPINFDPIRIIMQANPTLERVVIESSSTSLPDVPETPETLIMPHLRHLELNGVTLSSRSTQNLTLPSLQVLRLSGLPALAKVLERLVDNPDTSLAELVELTITNSFFRTTALTLALHRSPKLKILQLRSDFDANVIAQSLSKPPGSTLPPVLAFECRGLIPTGLPILCPSLEVLDLSGSPNLRTAPVMHVVKERLGLASSQDGGTYRLPGEESDRNVSCIQTLKVDECPHIEADILPWFRKNVPKFSCRYATTKERWRSA
jgi:F-box/TPR repeat protein Pof3